NAALRAYDGQSNTNLSTAGLFFEDRDLFLSTVDIGSLDKNLLFLNFVSPSYLGGPNNVFDDNNYYDYYFDAGAGHFFGPFWAGTAFRFGSATLKSKTNTETETAQMDTNGTQVGKDSTTLNGGANRYDSIDELLGASIIFGNKNWGIKDTLEIKQYRYEGYGNIVPGTYNTLYLDNTFSPGITIAPVAAGANNVITDTDANGRVITTSNTYSEGVVYRPGNNGKDNTWFNALEAGFVLGEMVSSMAALSPWAVVTVGFGVDQNQSVKDLRHDYSVSDSWGGGVSDKRSITYDAARAHFDIIPALAFGITVPLDDIFSFSPELAYTPRLNIYANKYTGIGGGEETAKGTVVSRTGSQWTYAGLAADGRQLTTTTTYNSAAVSEISYFGQTIGAGLKLAADFDRFALALKWSPVLDTDSTKTTTKESSRGVVKNFSDPNPYNNSTVITETTQEDDLTENSTVIFQNRFAVGAQLWLVPEKFRLNAGGIVTSTITSTTVKTTNETGSTTKTTTSYEDGHIDAASQAPVVATTIGTATYTQTYDSDTDFNGAYYMGCTWFFTDNVNLDFYLSNSAGGTAETNWAQLLMPSTWALQINIRY
ncbi:MAG: hypothetical protein LBK02_09265, partial [Treponema sp.]|nr:hypothetical protein [Treponema sp.]